MQTLDQLQNSVYLLQPVDIENVDIENVSSSVSLTSCTSVYTFQLVVLPVVQRVVQCILTRPPESLQNFSRNLYLPVSFVHLARCSNDQITSCGV